MQIYVLDEMEKRKPVEGAHARFIHSGNMTFAYWDLDTDAEVAEHHHKHEQVVNVLSGVLALTIDGTVHRLEAGTVAVVPPDTRHAAKCISPCRILDVFYPIREDFR